MCHRNTRGQRFVRQFHRETLYFANQRRDGLSEARMDQLDRITQNPAVMGGKACIRGMRVTVGMIVGQIGAGRSNEAVLAHYPYLDREDVLQALRHAAWLAEEREIVLPGE
jgi:uncharacterized protein (DUF433 family)